jgi:hypothetical protein
VPSHASLVVLGDTEFERCWLLEELKHWGWDYVLRQSRNNRVWRKQDSGVLNLDQIE